MTSQPNNEPLRLLAIDPGEKVGWATATVDDGMFVDTHGITPLREFALKLADVFANYDVVIYENYRISSSPDKLKAHIGSDVPTLQLIGMIRLLGWLNPSTKLVKQTPKNKTTAEVVQDEDIRAIRDSLPSAHDDSHDGDALLHLAYYYFRNHV